MRYNKGFYGDGYQELHPFFMIPSYGYGLSDSSTLVLQVRKNIFMFILTKLCDNFDFTKHI